MTSVLPIKSKLASQSGKTPKYAVSLKGPGGQSLTAVDPKATRAMVALMDMEAVIGGAASHYGGPAAFAELMSAVHAWMFYEAEERGVPFHELYNFVNDAGHCENGLYALKANYGYADLGIEDLRHFRSIESKLTGHGESHLFPEGVLLSNGPLGSAFPQSQGLAMADALSRLERITVTAISDGACMEGEAREAMAAIPGLAQNGQLAPYILIVSDNNTKLSGRIDEESFSMAPSHAALSTLGWDVIHLEDGHDLQACLDCFVQAVAKVRAAPRRPVAIHARTIKGIGTEKTKKSSSGGHGFPLKKAEELTAFLTEIYQGQEVPADFVGWTEKIKERELNLQNSKEKSSTPTEKIQVGISKALIRAKKAGYPLVSVSSDLPGSTGVAGFRKEFPESSFDVGVAEANMVSSAAGLSKAGYIPVVDTFAQFGVTKGALPHTMASLSECPMISVYSHTGFQDAADGASHQALTWLSMLAGIPDLEAYALSCSEEADELMFKAIVRMAEDRKAGRKTSQVAFFLGRENFPSSYGLAKESGYELGKAQVLRQPQAQDRPALCLLTAGSLVPEALAAAAALESQSTGVFVVNAACLNRPDVETLGPILEKCQGRLVTVEDHQLIGGMGALWTHALSLNGVPLQLRSLGVRGVFGQSSYTAKTLYQKHGLDSEAILRAAQSLLN